MTRILAHLKRKRDARSMGLDIDSAHVLLRDPSFCKPIIKLAKIIMPAKLLKVTGVHY